MKTFDLTRYTVGACAAAALLAGCGGSQPPIGAPTASVGAGGNTLPHHQTFQYTGKRQQFVVPAGVGSITVVARGAAGGSYGTHGGLGGRVAAVIPVYAGEKLVVFVGGAALDTSGAPQAPGRL